MKERLMIALALLACIGFSLFLIYLQAKQESDGQEPQEQVRESGIPAPPEIRTRLPRSEETGERPVFSLPGGFYPEEITVEITAPAGSRIYYTMDGSLPDAENGTLYEDPVTVTNICGNPNRYSAVSTISAYQEYAPLDTVEKAVVLQAVAVNASGEKSAVTCASYFIAMEAKTMYRDLPVLSLTTDPTGLFDYFEGNYVTGVDYENALAADELRFDSANYYRGNAITAHIEYFAEDRYLTYEGDVTMTLRKDGNLDYGQKSFLLTAPNPLPEQNSELNLFFEDGDLLLYGGGTDYTGKSRQFLEEMLLREKGTSFELEETKGCMVFLDGEFWGLYLMRRESTPETFAAKCGCLPEEIQLLKGSYPSRVTPELQELYRIVTEQDTGQPGTYQKIQERMDIESYLEYYCGNLFFGNPQFDSFSTTLWRWGKEGESDGKWHWEFNDATDTLGRNKLSNDSVNTFLCPGVSQDLFLQGLLKNPEFAAAFREKMEWYVEQMTQEAAEECLCPLLEKYRVAVTVTAARYGMRQTEESYLTDGDRILEYFGGRGEYILRYTEEFSERRIADGNNG